MSCTVRRWNAPLQATRNMNSEAIDSIARLHRKASGDSEWIYPGRNLKRYVTRLARYA